MRVLEGSVKEGICGGVWDIDVGTVLNVGECGMGNRGRHDFLLLRQRCWFSGGLRNGENGGSFYNLGGVPLQWRTLLWEARSLLQLSSPSIGQGIANGMELLCDK